MTVWRALGAVAIVVAYALVSHWLMVHAAASPWAVAVLFGPLLAVVAGEALRRRHLPSLLACAALVLVLAGVVERGGVGDVNRLYVLQHAGIHLVMGWTFAVTLRPGSTALVSALSERIHGTISLAMQAYTRRLTGVWVGYFGLMVLSSLALYAWAPWSWWSLFANLVTPLALAALLIGEHLLRYRWHPEFERVSLMQAVRAYRQFSAAPAVHR